MCVHPFETREQSLCGLKCSNFKGSNEGVVLSTNEVRNRCMVHAFEEEETTQHAAKMCWVDCLTTMLQAFGGSQ
jgi:hypothetical protein